MIHTQTFSSLTKVQKEAAGLLSIGTFLEYFDLTLYIHMAVILNELFFPKTDPYISKFIAAFTFCTTFIFRPLGALVFGYLGDTIGRKSTIVLTTFLTSITCFIMAVLPTYEQIGITAAWLLIMCRGLQGISSMGERTGAELYLIETTKLPARYPIVAMLAVASSLGGTMSLAISYLVTSFGYIMGWRIVFFIGTLVALIGSIARTTLRETPDFADAKRQIRETLKQSHGDVDKLKNNFIWKEKIKLKTALALFFIQCTWPACCYFFYIYCGSILKDSFGFTSEQVISQNFIVSLAQLSGDLIVAYLCYKIYPLKILKIKLTIFIIFMLTCPFLLNNLTSSYELLLMQMIAIVFVPTIYPAVPIFYIHFPILKRFTYPCFVHSMSRALIYVITSVGVIYLVNYFSSYGLFFVMIPILCGYIFGLSHFVKLEKEAGNYPEKKKQVDLYEAYQ